MQTFQQLGPKLWSLGYSVVPVPRGTDEPKIDHAPYAENQCDKRTLDGWVKNYPGHGVGVIMGGHVLNIDEALAETLIAQGKESNLKPEENDRESDAPFVPLGADGQVFYFYVPRLKSVVDMTTAKMQSINNLFLLAEKSFWEERFPRKGGGSDAAAATDWLINISVKAGAYSPDTLRGPGLWIDQGHALVNTGEVVYVDGERLDDLPITKKHVYAGGHGHIPDKAEPLTPVEVGELYELIQCASWKHPSSAAYLLGWITLAPLNANLVWRPHLWITGPSGAGKSFVGREIIGKTVPYLTWNQGTSTEAGLRQAMGQKNSPLVFEEADTDSDNATRRVANIIEWIRNASDSTAPVVRGTPSGKNLYFQSRFMAALMGIKVSLEHKQDLNRFTVLEMVVNKTPNFNAKGGPLDRLHRLVTPEFVARLFWRTAARHHQIMANIDIFISTLLETKTARFASQHGTLLAGYYSALNDDVATPEVARWLIDSIGDIPIYAEEDEEKDEIGCLQYLMLSTLRTKSGDEKPIYELIKDTKSLALGVKDEAVAALNGAGMTVVNSRDKGPLLALHVSSPNVKKIFAKSSWNGSKWQRSLLRVEGVVKRPQKISGFLYKCVCIPIQND